MGRSGRVRAGTLEESGASAPWQTDEVASRALGDMKLTKEEQQRFREMCEKTWTRDEVREIKGEGERAFRLLQLSILHARSGREAEKTLRAMVRFLPLETARWLWQKERALLGKNEAELRVLDKNPYIALQYAFARKMLLESSRSLPGKELALLRMENVLSVADRQLRAGQLRPFDIAEIGVDLLEEDAPSVHFLGAAKDAKELLQEDGFRFARALRHLSLSPENAAALNFVGRDGCFLPLSQAVVCADDKRTIAGTTLLHETIHSGQSGGQKAEEAQARSLAAEEGNWNKVAEELSEGITVAYTEALRPGADDSPDKYKDWANEALSFIDGGDNEALRDLASLKPSIMLLRLAKATHSGETAEGAAHRFIRTWQSFQ